VSISALVQLTETPDGHSGLEVMARVARVVPLALAAPSAGALALRNHLALILGGVRFAVASFSGGRSFVKCDCVISAKTLAAAFKGRISCGCQ
jgi:hypothetical protein